MTTAERVELIRRQFGQSAEQQAAGCDARAVYWDRLQSEADRSPGMYVPGAFKAEGDRYRAAAEEIRIYITTAPKSVGAQRGDDDGQIRMQGSGGGS